MEKERKLSHIQLTFDSQTPQHLADQRFNYEPLFAGRISESDLTTTFLGKTLKAPLWISSMTGGTEIARKINHNLARACAEFGLGMGLGSCRKLLDDNTYFEDFNLRPVMGNELPLFANLGIAQVEELLTKKETDRVNSLVDKLQADGLIIHVNPLQEWIQPEGDIISRPPLETIGEFLEKSAFPVIVKEVGQGFGPESLLKLLQLPLAAVDFGAYGGTNFSLIELKRHNNKEFEKYEPFTKIGHTAAEMLEMANHLSDTHKDLKCNQLIISGGIKNYLDGHYLIHRAKIPAIYAQASAFLKYSQADYESLQKFTAGQIEGLQMAKTVLKIRE